MDVYCTGKPTKAPFRVYDTVRGESVFYSTANRKELTDAGMSKQCDISGHEPPFFC